MGCLIPLSPFLGGSPLLAVGNALLWDAAKPELKPFWEGGIRGRGGGAGGGGGGLSPLSFRIKRFPSRQPQVCAFKTYLLGRTHQWVGQHLRLQGGQTRTATEPVPRSNAATSQLTEFRLFVRFHPFPYCFYSRIKIHLTTNPTPQSPHKKTHTNICTHCFFVSWCGHGSG